MAWFILFLGVTLLVILTDVNVEFVYLFTVASVILCGVFGAICSGGVFGMVAQFPAMYVQAVMSGQGLSGLTAAMVSMIAALANDGGAKCVTDAASDAGADDDAATCSKYTAVDYGSFSYFLVALLVFLGCIAGYLALERSPFARHYDLAGAPRPRTTEESNAYSPLALEGGAPGSALPPAEGGAASAASGAAEARRPRMADYRRILFALRREAFSVWFVFTVTIGLFPAVTAGIRPLQQAGCASGGPFTDATFTAFLFGEDFKHRFRGQARIPQPRHQQHHSTTHKQMKINER